MSLKVLNREARSLEMVCSTYITKAFLLRYVFNTNLHSVKKDIPVQSESIRFLCKSFSILYSSKKNGNQPYSRNRSYADITISKGLNVWAYCFTLKFKIDIFGEKTLSPWKLLNNIKTSNLETLFLILMWGSLDIFHDFCYSST